MKKIKQWSRVAVITLGLVMASWVAAQERQQADISFVDLDGQSVKLSDFRGKWVVVNFWATWCPPCNVEIPELSFFHSAHKDKDAIVLGVDYEEAPTKMIKQFIKKKMINYPIVRLPGKIDGRTTPFGPLKGLPTTYMVSPKGQVVAAHTGMVNQKMLEDFIGQMTSR